VRVSHEKRNCKNKIYNQFNLKKMKKKILGGIAVLAIAVVAAWNVNLSSQSNDLSDISLANVEALAIENDPIVLPKDNTKIMKWGYIKTGEKACIVPNGSEC
jgi:hypothetical protein